MLYLRNSFLFSSSRATIRLTSVDSEAASGAPPVLGAPGGECCWWDLRRPVTAAMLPYGVQPGAHRGSGQPDDPFGASEQFLASLALNSALGLAFFLVFAGLRRALPSVYSPRSEVRLLAAQPPPPALPRGLLAWLGPLLATDEECVLDSAGLDVVMYLRFLRVAFQVLVAASLFGFAVLIPIIRFAPDLSFPDTQTSPQWWLDSNATSGNSSSDQAVPWLDNLSITHVRSGSPLFYAHLALAYLATGLTLFLVHVNYRGYARLRHRFIFGGRHTGERCAEHEESMPECWDVFASDRQAWRKEVQQHHSWVLVNDIPEEYRSEEALGAFFAQMYPHTYACCIFARDTRVLAKMVDKRQKVLEQLEHSLAKTQLRTSEQDAPEGTCLNLARMTRDCMRTVLPSSARKEAEQRMALEEQLDALNVDIAGSLARSNLPSSDNADTNPHARTHARTPAHAHAHTRAHAHVLTREHVRARRAPGEEADEWRGWSSDEEAARSQAEAEDAEPHAPTPPNAINDNNDNNDNNANAALQGLQRVVDAAERLTGIDIDGDGRTGGLDNPVLGSAFVAFRDVRSAMHAQLVQHHTDVSCFTVQSCPAPADVVWSNVGMPAHSRWTRKLVGLAATLWLTFFWTVPVGFITSFSQLDNLVRVFPVRVCVCVCVCVYVCMYVCMYVCICGAQVFAP